MTEPTMDDRISCYLVKIEGHPSLVSIVQYDPCNPGCSLARRTLKPSQRPPQIRTIQMRNKHMRSLCILIFISILKLAAFTYIQPGYHFSLSQLPKSILNAIAGSLPSPSITSIFPCPVLLPAKITLSINAFCSSVNPPTTLLKAA